MGAFLHHLFRALWGYIQKWTAENIPAIVNVKYNFGHGEVPAAPVDECGVSVSMCHVREIYQPIVKETCGVSIQLTSAREIRTPICRDNCSVSISLVDVSEVA